MDDRRQRKKQVKSLPLVAPIHPLKGYHSKAEVVATLSCYAVHRPSEFSAAVRLTSRVRSQLFVSATLPLLNRISTGGSSPLHHSVPRKELGYWALSGGSKLPARIRTAPKQPQNQDKKTSLPPFGWIPSNIPA